MLLARALARSTTTGRFHSRRVRVSTTFHMWDFAPDFYHQLHGTLSSEQQLTIVTWRLRDTRNGAAPLRWLHSLAQTFASNK